MNSIDAFSNRANDIVCSKILSPVLIIEVEEKEWKIFFGKILIPFVNHLKERTLIESFRISLNPGQLTLRFQLNPQLMINVATEFKAYRDNNKLTIAQAKHLKVTRSALPARSILDKVLCEQAYFPGDDFSEIVMNRVAALGYDEHVKLSLALYFHFAWIRTRKIVGSETMSSIILKGYCWTLNDKLTNEISATQLEQRFIQIRQELIGIYESIMPGKPGGLKRLPDWVVYWCVICRDKITSNMMLYFNREHLLEMSYYKVPAMINQYLGLSQKEILLVTYYINQIVVAFEKKRLKNSST
jgi:hypothetical protein